MARFRIKKDNLPGLVWLVDFAFVGSRRESCLAVEQACELRDLLNKEFPVEPARAEHVLTEERCPDERADRGLHNGDCRRCAICRQFIHPGDRSLCAGPVKPAQAEPTPEPDPDEVRRALDDINPGVLWQTDRLASAARAWLRLREQQPTGYKDRAFTDAQWAAAYNRMCRERDDALIQVDQLTAQVLDLQREQQQTPPTPTIAQVIQACGGPYDSVSVVPDRGSTGWRAFVYKSGGADSQFSAFADTPEAALSKLYTDAVERLRQQRDEVQDKLTKLGVEL